MYVKDIVISPDVCTRTASRTVTFDTKKRIGASFTGIMVRFRTENGELVAPAVSSTSNVIILEEAEYKQQIYK